jgi:hypothetical protein
MESEDGEFLHTCSDGNLINLSCLAAKTNAALAPHSEDALQYLISQFSDACKEFGLTISIKKTNILDQDISTTPMITISDHILEALNKFT